MSRICLSVCVAVFKTMNLSLIFVLLISSVVFASGSSCDVNENVTVQNPKYLKSDGGFFFIHGLTNGESVVMYKTQAEQKVYVQHTFINDDCSYETTRYIMNDDGLFVNYTKVLKQPAKFSIRETLSFIVEGQAVEINFKINMNGFVLNDVTEIETVEPEMSKGEFLCAEESNVRDVSKFEFEYKNTIELNYKEDGRLFYQQAGSSNYVEGKYVFKTSNNDYVTFDYIINPVFRDNAKIRIERYNVRNSDKFSEDIELVGTTEFLNIRSYIQFCFKSTGVMVHAEQYYEREYLPSPGGLNPALSFSRAG